MTITTTVSSFTDVSLGEALPPDAPHAISVSLPKWRDNVDYELGNERVVGKMVSGYPRFFISLNIQRLATICEQKYAIHGEKCLLLPSRVIAAQCRAFIEARSKPAENGKTSLSSCTVRCVEERRSAYYTDANGNHNDSPSSPSSSSTAMSLYIVLFPSDTWSIAKEFWQHTGLGISSRFAERFLSLSEDNNAVLPSPTAGMIMGGGGPKTHHKHYSVKGKQRGSELSPDHTTYLEERYGRNLPIRVAASAKRALRRRLAGVLIKDVVAGDDGELPSAGQKDTQLGPSSRGVKDLAEDDVYLFPTGMSAIWTAHQCLLGAVGPLEAKSVCFGFTYTDTLKILQKWGPGCYFFGRGLDADIDELQNTLEGLKAEQPDGERPILALFTEFPSNPLLRSANLPRLRELADKYDFAIVVDETVGSLINVDVIRYADIVASSLTKIFSGDANVMGGCLVLNPQGRYYKTLKHHLETTYEDVYFDEDAIYLERNSRDFKRRIWQINHNTEAVCDFLRSRSLAGGRSTENTVIKEVYYPKYITPANYDQCRKKKGASDSTTSAPDSTNNDGDEKEGGYGGLFSLTFVSKTASEAFYDALECFKGPSLGTNFTLACPYTILAHFAELDWAAGYGVEEGLVRISIGKENKEDLLARFSKTLKKAEEAHSRSLATEGS